MRPIAFFCLLVLLPPFVSAQDSLGVRLNLTSVSPDSTEVTLVIGEAGDSLRTPIWAFEFKLTTSKGIAYLGVSSQATLASKPGWSTAANVPNSWAGGFASSTNAIETAGTLIALHFDVSKQEGKGKVCLSGIRLNSGTPRAVPRDVCGIIE